MSVVGFSEDPGAANFLLGMRRTLAAVGVNFTLYASGTAAGYFVARGEEIEFLPSDPLEIGPLLKGVTVALVGTSDNPESPSLALIDACRDMDIPSIGVVDAPTLVGKRFVGMTSDPLGHRPDFVVAAHPEVIGKCQEIGLTAEEVVVVRHPHHDRIESRRVDDFIDQDLQAKRYELFGDVADKKVVVLVCEPSDRAGSVAFHRSPTYTLTGWGKSEKRTQIVAEELLDAVGQNGTSVHLVFRLHPKDEPSDYARYTSKVDQISINEDPLEVVYFADLVIGLTGNLMTEAAVLGKPVFSIIPDPAEQDWIPVATNPPIESVWTREAIESALSKRLAGSGFASYQRVDASRPSLLDVLLKISEQGTRVFASEMSVAQTQEHS